MNWLLLKNSLLVSGFATLLAVAFGLAAALWATGLERRWRQILTAVSIIALALPPFLVTNCWLHFLGRTGVWRSWLPFDIFSLGGTVWILSLLTWPITFLLLSSAWQQLERAQLESDPCVTEWAFVRALLWPLARPAIAQATVLTFVLALNNFAVPAILQVKVSTDEMWIVFNTSFDTAAALRMSWPLVLFPLLLLFWLARRGIAWPRTEGGVPARLFRRQLGPGWTSACGVFSVMVGLLSVGLPVFQLVSLKRTWTELPGALQAGWDAVAHSFWLAAASAALIVALSLALRYAVARRNERTAFRIAGALLWLPFLVPGVLLGIGLITVFNRPGIAFFYQSFGIVLLAFLIRYLAIGASAVRHSLESVDPDLTDAARLEGANSWQVLRHVHWPQAGSQIMAAWYIAFLLCLWDVESIVLVVPPGGETLSLRIFNLLHYGHNAQVNALCLMLLLMAVAPLLLWVCWSVIRQPAVPKLLAKAGHASYITASAALLVAGCNPSSGPQHALQSTLFDHIEIIGSRGVGVGQLNKPRSVAVDGQDNLYVVDMTGRVQKFSPSGAFLLSWQMPQTDLGKPKGMCRDRQGNIVLVEPHYQRVNHFSPDGKLVAQWGKFGTNTGEFTLPRAVAVNSHNEFYVSEYTALERVQQFRWLGVSQPPDALVAEVRSDSIIQTPTKRVWPPPKMQTLTPDAVSFMKAFGQAGNAPGDFNRPEGICVDAQDRVYVADSCNHRIEVFDRDGKFLRTYGKAGGGKGELSYPYDICVDKAGRQYVCEFGNSRIQVFDANDQPIEIIGGPGGEPGQFSNPWGVALDSAGNLYVADSLNHRVQKLIRKQTVVSVFTPSSSSFSSFSSISSIEVARMEEEQEEEEEEENVS